MLQGFFRHPEMLWNARASGHRESAGVRGDLGSSRGRQVRDIPNGGGKSEKTGHDVSCPYTRNEKVELDGLQIVGVPYRNAVANGSLESVLRGMPLDQERASILLIHAPDHPEVAEAAGFSLQLSGHTHLGQFIPWSWMARRIYRQFVYGLSRIGKMQVFTSSGAGTWGPPLRLGSNPEIVMLEFE